MPTTSPRMLNSGPPELPGLMATSVWMNGTKFSFGSERPFALTMPAGTGVSNANGQRAPLRAYDAGGDRVLEAERRADRHHPLAHLQLVRVAELDHRQVVGAVDL